MDDAYEYQDMVALIAERAVQRKNSLHSVAGRWLYGMLTDEEAYEIFHDVGQNLIEWCERYLDEIIALEQRYQ